MHLVQLLSFSFSSGIVKNERFFCISMHNIIAILFIFAHFYRFLCALARLCAKNAQEEFYLNCLSPDGQNHFHGPCSFSLVIFQENLSPKRCHNSPLRVERFYYALIKLIWISHLRDDHKMKILYRSWYNYYNVLV